MNVKEPPQIVVKFANMVFVLGVLFSILLIVYAIYKIFNPPEPVSPIFYTISILFGGVFAILFGFGLKRLSNNLRVNLSLLLFVIGISVYGFEFFLNSISNILDKRQMIAKQQGIPFDTRSPMEVLDDLNASGIKAYPDVVPNHFMINGLITSQGKIVPLGGISNVTTILPNEAGFYPVFKTDEHGFNNSKGLYNNNKVDIMLLGDSYTEGYSVNQDETIGAVLREAGFHTISLGQGSNGPLLEFASLKEYAEPLEPKIVVWISHPNDITDISGTPDLDMDLRSSLLRKYLNEKDFSQNLISRQKEIDNALISFVGAKKETYVQDERKRKIMGIIYNLKLINLRTRLNLKPVSILKPKSSSIIPIFKNIMHKSNQMVSGWGGKMYFAYLPSSVKRQETSNESPNRDVIMQIITDLEIPIIDIQKEVFDLYPDPLSLYTFKMLDMHYNAEGYRLIAEAISNADSVDAAKSIYDTLQGAVGSSVESRNEPKSLSEAITKGSATMLRQKQRKEKQDPHVQRMKKLAGI